MRECASKKGVIMDYGARQKAAWRRRGGEVAGKGGAWLRAKGSMSEEDNSWGDDGEGGNVRRIWVDGSKKVGYGISKARHQTAPPISAYPL